MRIKRTGRLITRERCEAFKQSLSRKFRTNNVIATQSLKLICRQSIRM